MKKSTQIRLQDQNEPLTVYMRRWAKYAWWYPPPDVEYEDTEDIIITWQQFLQRNPLSIGTYNYLNYPNETTVYYRQRNNLRYKRKVTKYNPRYNPFTVA